MILLALDTATRYASVALADDGILRAELTWQADQAHSATLLPNVERLFRLAGLSKGEVHAIAVVRGPGGYNGLRVGVSTAKALARAWQVPLVGVSTLAVQAFPFAAAGRPVCALQAAGRGEVAAAVYRERRGAWTCLLEETVLPIDALVERLPRGAVIVHEAGPDVEAALRRAGQGFRFPPPLVAVRRAAPLAALARARLAAGPPDPPETLEPLYLRRPHLTLPTKSPLSEAEG